ncbi:MAG: pyruvate dehydrogenase (acetyl-transferring) E1 component subunit alpha [Elusimicrobia bacterium]|nr:pyruvate dehydrogenase (acetyl-transferring) E1 component subunit alpha [Elusimicrobiota bacterium]
MPLKRLAEYRVERLEVLDCEGRCDPALKPQLRPDQIREIYRLMVTSRRFDEKAFRLQRQGRLGTYAPISGQEASQVAPPYCLQKSDWMVPTYRSAGAYYTRGVPFKNILIYWGGDARGARVAPDQRDLFPTICIATQIPFAVGLAWGAKLKAQKEKKTSEVVLCYFGDGATSKADFHEGLNFAGVFRLPIIFVCENNQWAISLPRSRQTAAPTFSQRAFSYGMEGIQVDGNDVFAVHRATQAAVERARAGKGPTLVECETYRLGDHTTADDASRYRSAEEVARWQKLDPIVRLKKYMLQERLWSEAEETKLSSEADLVVEAAVEEAEAFAAPNPVSFFDHTFAELPWNVLEQRKALEEYLKEKDSRKDTVILDKEGRFP